ncbi:MAG: hypothetical protein ACJ746_16870 [Bryobacteraceae bacterium]
MQGQSQDAGAVSLTRRLIFWDFPRASWPYDVVVALILLFIFATPREFFRDQPKSSGIVLMSPSHGSSRFFVETELLSALSEEGRVARVATLIRERFGRKAKVQRVEPIWDETEKEVKGFIAYSAP